MPRQRSQCDDPETLVLHGRLMRWMLRVEEIAAALDRELDRCRYAHAQLLAASDVDPQAIEAAIEEFESDTESEYSGGDDDESASDGGGESASVSDDGDGDVEDGEIVLSASPSPPPKRKRARSTPAARSAKRRRG